MPEDDEEERTNPFENLESAVGEREGNPFEELTPPDRSDEGQSEPDRQAKRETGEQAAKVQQSPPTDPDLAAEEAETEDLDHAIEQREIDSPAEMPSLSDTDARQGDPFQGLEDAFSEVDVEGLDPDAVWEELTSAQSRGSISDSSKRTYAEVSKHAYCEGCEHFSKPPDVHCTNEGTEIVEFLDTETVRVVDCPVVTERAQLQSGGHGKD